MSFRMSKQLAFDIARQLTKKKRDEIDKMEKQLGRFLKSEYEKQIPVAIKRLAKLYPGWFDYTDEVYLLTHGFSHKKYDFYLLSKEKELPRPTNESPHIVLDNKLSDIIHGMQNKIIDLKKDYELLKTQIEAALLGLSTFARIEEKFPEAVKFIPVPTSREIAINIDPIREKLKQ